MPLGTLEHVDAHTCLSWHGLFPQELRRERAKPIINGTCHLEVARSATCSAITQAGAPVAMPEMSHCAENLPSRLLPALDLTRALERIPIRWNSDRRSSFLFGRIFCDEPVSTSSENALATFQCSTIVNRPPLPFPIERGYGLERFSIRWNQISALASCLVAFSTTNRYPLRRKMLQCNWTLHFRSGCVWPQASSHTSPMTRAWRRSS